MDIKSYKKSFEYSYTFGIFPTIELIKSKSEKVIKVLVSSKYKTDSDTDIFELCKKYNIKTEVNDKVINRISDKENNFVVGIFSKYECELNDNESHVVLVNPSNMGNMGTIIRTLTGFGLNNLAIIAPGVDIFDPKVIRGSMGSLFRINFKYYDNFNRYNSSFKNHKKYTFMLDGAISLKEVHHDKNELFSLVFGNEAKGLDSSYSSVGKSILIKHTDRIDSLNLPIAVGIALYHFFN
ncbi:TrmH family RNA methyltransferase [Sedimentibacter hydroxybenzoicus DSM 7310]|uniref:TrmH family RNA methyltransferase n=1 Tax=Sedimentibacter hydroxybenzoicus DSM 7310 TaxID=1123245 RepID=A0A974BN33_SEDHY|nr:TrmH family RNA methyltransferase [Sedimentibacter hydroxybenzoicus]NYB75782.1 TrmH family RNA methyltransferase [Sedimentibacter hydroxybenzoicus DSM 7310]